MARARRRPLRLAWLGAALHGFALLGFAPAGAEPLATSHVAAPAVSRAAPPAPDRAAHPGPPIFVEFTLAGSDLELTLTGEQRVLCTWLDEPAPLALPLAPDVRARLLARAAEVLPELGRVELDGTPVAPRVVDAAAYDASLRLFGDEPVLELDLVYPSPTGAPPERVHVRWARYPEDTRGGPPKVPLHFTSEEAFEYLVLLEDEPEFTWHRPTEHGLALAPRPLAADEGRSAGGALLLAVGVALLAGGAVALRSPRARTVGLAVALGGALLVPWVPRGARVPDEAEALALWEELHRRVYGAFDATTEEQVYRLLEASVEQALIDPLYAGIHESLILREEGGGAVARVEKVEVLERTFRPRGELDGRPAFEVDATWRVDGGVVHFGHEHQRRTRYRAVCTVVHDGDAWRLGGMDVREQVREPLRD